MAADRVDRLADLAMSYREVGATGVALPDGYDHLARDVVVGSGRRSFEAAAEAVMTWEMHRGADVAIEASSPRAATGVNVLATLRVGLVRVEAPCRVVHTVEQPDRIGFTYGTLHGHPAAGEESFSVLLEADEQVRFVIIAFSRPVSILARLAGPLGRLAQQQVTDRYVDAVRRAATLP